ncbi:MAG TPA: DsbA family oxidoreductase [Acidimicrobiales bacterium]|nr:DsbA family oxidoreductase [Acidimicrobiales bacterium]
MRVDVWSDVVCPWCAIGRAHLGTALSQFEHGAEVTVRWRSFELDPSAPRRRPGEYAALLAAKYGTDRATAQAMIDRMADRAAAAGLEFHLERAQPGNTFDAHRILHLAADAGIADAVGSRLFAAYLAEGEAIGERSVLARLAASSGLDADAVGAVLETDRYADAVRADEREAGELGVSGVPFFLVDGRFAVAGAQPPEIIADTLRRAWTRRQMVTVAGDGPACGPGGCS